jgi:hypothetical protein
MQENSEKLSQHLYNVLQLNSEAIEDEEIQHIFDPDTYLTDIEINEYATQHSTCIC